MLKSQPVSHQRHWRCLPSRCSQNDGFLQTARSITPLHEQRVRRSSPESRLQFKNQSTSTDHKRVQNGNTSFFYRRNRSWAFLLLWHCVSRDTEFFPESPILCSHDEASGHHLIRLSKCCHTSNNSNHKHTCGVLFRNTGGRVGVAC